MRVFLVHLLKEPMPNFIDHESNLAQKTPGTSTFNKSLGNPIFSNQNSEFLNSIGKKTFLWRRCFNGRTIFWINIFWHNCVAGAESPVVMRSRETRLRLPSHGLSTWSSAPKKPTLTISTRSLKTVWNPESSLQRPVPAAKGRRI